MPSTVFLVNLTYRRLNTASRNTYPGLPVGRMNVEDLFADFAFSQNIDFLLSGELTFWRVIRLCMTLHWTMWVKSCRNVDLKCTLTYLPKRILCILTRLAQKKIIPLIYTVLLQYSDWRVRSWSKNNQEKDGLCIDFRYTGTSVKLDIFYVRFLGENCDCCRV